MNKKILVMCLVIVVIVLGLVLQNRLQQYSLLEDIGEVTKKVTTSENIQIRVVKKYKDGTEKITETYAKDGVYVTKKIDASNLPSNTLEWSTDNNDGVCNNYYEYEFEYDGKVVKGLNCQFNHQNKANNQLATRLATGDLLFIYTNANTNIINMPKVTESDYNGKVTYELEKDGRTWIIDKETLLTLAIEDDIDEEVSGNPYMYTFEYDITAPEGIYDAPNAAYYDKVEFFEFNYTGPYNSSDEKEKAISGTELKPGEELIELVEITKDEELNFLGLTENEFGVQGLNIGTLETYNKFRERYSGLRELTKEDFKDYYVAIAYKEGYKLNNKQQLISEESRVKNFVFTADKSNKDSLVLIVTPRTTKSNSAAFIISNEDLKITEADAIKTISENINDLKEAFGLVLDSENYVNARYSKIEVLNKDEFVNLDYIKTPVKGEEPACWLLSIVDANNKTVGVYVNITTGNLIGAIAGI